MREDEEDIEGVEGLTEEGSPEADADQTDGTTIDKQEEE